MKISSKQGVINIKPTNKVTMASGFYLGGDQFNEQNHNMNHLTHRHLTARSSTRTPNILMSNNNINAGIQPALSSQVQNAINVLNNGGEAYGFDFEWVGDISENASNDAKRLFSITEAGLVKRVYDKAGNVTSKEVISDLVFGITEFQEESFRKVIYSDSVSDPSMKYIMDYLARVGSAVKQNGGRFPTNMVGGVAVPYMPPVGHYNANDINARIYGLNALRQLGKDGWIYNTNDKTIGKEYMTTFINNLNSISSNTPTIGHNIFGADIKNWNTAASLIPGMPSIEANNPFFIDSYELLRDSGFNSMGLYTNLNTGVRDGFSKQENLAKTVDILADWHRATADAGSTIDTFMSRSANIGGVSIFEKIQEQIHGNMLGFKQSDLVSNTAFIANSGLAFENRTKLDKSGKELFSETLDFVYYQDNLKTNYAEDRFSRNVFRKGFAYELSGIQEIDLNNMTKGGEFVKNSLKSLDGLDKIYSATFNEVDPTNPAGAVRTSVIYRNTMEELTQAIQANLSVADKGSEAWTIAVSKAENRRLDNARRSIDRVNDVKGSYSGGFEKFVSINKNIEKFNNIKLSNGQKAFNSTEQIISTVLRDGSKNDISGLLSAEQISVVDSFRNGSGQVELNSLLNFTGTYNYYNSSYSTNIAIAKSILDNGKFGGADVIVNANKSAVFNNMYAELFNEIEANGYSITNKAPLPANRAGYNIKVGLKGDTHYLDATSPDAIQRNLRNIAMSGVGGDSKNKDLVATNRLQAIYKDLRDRNLLTDEQIRELSSDNVMNVHYSTKRASELIHNNFRSMIPNLLSLNNGSTDDGLIIPDLNNDALTEQLKTKNKELKNLGKNTVKQIKEKGYDQYVGDIDSEINALKTSLEEKISTRRNLQGRNVAPNKFPVGYSSSDVKKLEQEISKLEKHKKKVGKYNTIQSERNGIVGNLQKNRDIAKEIKILEEVTGYGSQESYNLANGIVVTDRDGNVVKGGIDSVIKTLNVDFKDIYDRSSNASARYTSPYTVGKKGIATGDSAFVEKYLMGELGFGRTEIDAFRDVMYGRKGVLSQRGDNGEALGFGFIKRMDEHGRERDFMVITTQDKLNSLNKIEETGVFGNDVVQVEFGRIRDNNGIETIIRGGQEKLNTKSINFFVNTKDLRTAESVIANANMRMETTSSRIVHALNYIKGDIIDAVKNNNGQAVASRFSKAAGAILSQAEQGTGYIYDNVDSNIVKKYIGSATDAMKSQIVRDFDMINLLPFLYKEDDKVRENINSIFNNVLGYDESKVNGMFNDWMTGALSSQGDYYKGPDKDSVHPLIREYWETNKLGGDALYSRIRDSKFINRVNKAEDVVGMLDEFVQYGSQIISDTHVAEGKISMANLSKMLPYGDVTGPFRPALTQTGQAKMLDVTNMPSWYRNLMRTRGTTLGTTIDVYNNAIESLYNAPGVSNDLVNGLTVQFKNVKEADVLKGLSKFDNIDSNTINSFRNYLDSFKMYTAIDSSNFTDEYIMNLLQNNLQVLKIKTGTYQQGGAMSPFASAMFNKPIYHEFDVSDIASGNLDSLKGRYVRHGDVLGYDDAGKSIKYENKRSGTVQGVYGGKIVVAEDNPAIGHIKSSLGIGEKSATAMFGSSYDDLFSSNTLAQQFMWDSGIGNNTDFIGNFDIKKHMSGAYAFSELTDITRSLMNMENDQEILDIILGGTNFGSEQEKMDYIQGVKDMYLNEIRNIYGNINGGVGDEMYTGLIGTPNEYSVLTYLPNMDKNKNVAQAYKEAIDALANSNDAVLEPLYKRAANNKRHGIYTVAFKELQANAQFNANIDGSALESEIISNKGYKATYRGMLQFAKVPGHSPESREFFMKNSTTFTGETISNWMHEQIRKSSEYKKATETLVNINLAVKLQSGMNLEQAVKDLDTAQEMLVKKVSIKDVFVHNAGMTEEDVLSTIFGLGYDANGNRIANAIEIDLGNFEIINPMKKTGTLSNKISTTTNKLIIPVLKNEYIGKDNFFMPQGIQKNVASLVTEINRAIDGRGNINTTDYINKRMIDMYDAIADVYLDKNGLIKSGMMSGTLDFSARQLYGKVLEPLFDDNNNPLNDALGNVRRNVTLSNGTVINGYLDVVMTSRQGIVEMAGESVFNDIGYQLMHEGFDNNNEFVGHLKNKGLINERGMLLNGSTYDSIGEEYVKKVGLPGISNRDPDFHADAQLAVYYRMSDALDDGTSVYMHSWTAIKQNADTDWDSHASALLVHRGEDGRIKIQSKDTVLRQDFERLVEGQAIDNANVWVKAAINESEELNKLGELTPDNFLSFMKEAEYTNFEDSKALFRIAKNRYDKVAIGGVSNVNLQLKELGTIALKYDGKNDFSLDNYYDLEKFDHLIEQKPISSKHAKGTSTHTTIGATSQYTNAVKKIMTGDKEQGADELLKAFMDMGLLGKDNVGVDDLGQWYFKNGDQIINASELLSGSYRDIAKNIDGELGTMIRGVGAIATLSETSAINSLRDDYLLNKGLVNSKNYDKTLLPIASGKSGNLSVIGGYTQKARPIASRNIVRNSLSDNVYYDGSGASWQVSSMYKGNGGTLFSLTNGESTYTYLNDIKGNDVTATTNTYIQDRLGLNGISTTGVDGDIVDILRADSRLGLELNSQMANTTTGEYEQQLKSINDSIIERAREIKEGRYDESISFSPTTAGLDIGTKAITGDFSPTTYTGSSDLYNKRLADIDSYAEELSSSIGNVINNDIRLNSLDGQRIADITTGVYADVMTEVTSHQAKLSNGITKELIGDYASNTDDFKNAYGWSNDINTAISGMNDSNAIDTINAFGTAKVGYGKYVGYELSELSSSQIDDTLSDIYSAIPSSDEMTTAFLSDNITAIENYRTAINHADSVKGSNDAIIDTIRNINSRKVHNEFTATMVNGAESEALRLRMYAMNEQIIEEANNKAKIKASKISDRVDNVAEGVISSGISGKHLAIGAAVVAGSMFVAGMTSGGNLNPDANAYSQTEETRANAPGSSRLAIPRQQQANQVYMQPINATKRVYAKTPYSQVNNSNVINAMNVAYRGTASKITINNNGGYDSDDKWFEKEMAQQLS